MRGNRPAAACDPLAGEADDPPRALLGAAATFRRRLLGWYAKHARELPWRRDRDPYRVWLSEVMLQQTQVEAVKPYFERFIAAWPTVANLASASESRVLRMWEGLGYYRRARSLHAAAKQIVAAHGGRFPQDVATLTKLPGVGRYTAGAIASIAFDQPAPIVEANTARLYARLLALRGPLAGTAAQKALWGFAESIVPQRDASRFNQALMELGSLVCKPTAPACESCPVAAHCRAFAEGLTGSIPAPAVRPTVESVHQIAVVVRRGETVLLRQCGPSERCAGLWDFARFDGARSEGARSEGVRSSSEADSADLESIVRGVRELTGVACKPTRRLGTLKHGVTRFRITLDCWLATWRSGSPRGAEWAPIPELADRPLSVTGRKIAQLLAK